tara:strand:- start:31 stop:360 length:330 start_codon:yes stop_codon:yes gene_type:complete
MDLTYFKNQLEIMRVQNLDLQENSMESRKPVNLDQSQQGRLSRMDAIQLQEMALESQRRREEQLLKIDFAMKRIETGEYFECIQCGEKIAEKRLEVDPTCSRCIECANN